MTPVPVSATLPSSRVVHEKPPEPGSFQVKPTGGQSTALWELARTVMQGMYDERERLAEQCDFAEIMLADYIGDEPLKAMSEMPSGRPLAKARSRSTVVKVETHSTSPTAQLATNNPVPVGPDPCPAAKNAKGIPTAQIVIASRLIPRKRTLSAIFDETQ